MRGLTSTPTAHLHRSGNISVTIRTSQPVERQKGINRCERDEYHSSSQAPKNESECLGRCCFLARIACKLRCLPQTLHPSLASPTHRRGRVARRSYSSRRLHKNVKNHSIHIREARLGLSRRCPRTRCAVGEMDRLVSCAKQRTRLGHTSRTFRHPDWHVRAFGAVTRCEAQQHCARGHSMRLH